MFKMDDTVRIRKTGVVGSITDISCAGGSTVYVIDTDTGDDEEGGFGGMYSVFYCTEEELEKVLELIKKRSHVLRPLFCSNTYTLVIISASFLS